MSGEKFIINDKQKLLFENSEKISKTNQIEAIKSYKATLKLNLKGPLAVPAAFSIAYYYDQETLPDSALKYYQWIIDNFPKSEQSSKATERMEAINLALSVIEPDSTDASIMEPN